MTRLVRPLLVAIAFGLVLSVTTGVQQAHAWTGPDVPMTGGTYSDGHRYALGRDNPNGQDTMERWVNTNGRLQYNSPTTGVDGSTAWVYAKMATKGFSFGCETTSPETSCEVIFYWYNTLAQTDVGVMNAPWDCAQGCPSGVTNIHRWGHANGTAPGGWTLNAPANWAPTANGGDPGVSVAYSSNDFGGGFQWFGFACGAGAASCWVDDITGLGADWVLPNNTWTRVAEGGTADNSSVCPPGSYVVGGEPGMLGCGAVDPTADSFVPRLACGRTLRDLGNGQWVADVEGFVRNASELDSEGEWRVSWDAEAVYEGRSASIPLPENATSSSDLYATFILERTATSFIGFDEAQQLAGQWVQTGSDLPDGIAGGMAFPAWVADRMLNGQIRNGHAMPDGVFGAAYEFQEGGVTVGPVTTLTRADSVRAYCVMRVSPVTMGQDGGQKVVVEIDIPPHGDEDTSDDDYTGGEKCRSENTGIIGVISDIVEAVQCAVGGVGDLLGDILGGLFDGLIGLLQEIWDWLKDMDIPGISGLHTEWSSKFPVSVVAEAVSAFGALDDALQSGMADSCGPTFAPDVSTLPGLAGADTDSLSVSLPSPNAACNDSEFATQAADLGGFRSPLRSFFVVLLWAGFFVKVATSIGPGRSGIEPTEEKT